MIFWTVASLEDVFSGYPEHAASFKEITRGSITMVVEPTENGYGKIVRLISPNCYDYLNPNLAPGMTIQL